MKLKVYYKIKDTRITSWVKMSEEDYYVFDDIWIVGGRGGNKRGFIKRALENHLETVSYRINYPPYDSQVYHTKIESDILVKNLEEFKSNLFELERNLLKELEEMLR